jgi:hypothetical protein
MPYFIFLENTYDFNTKKEGYGKLLLIMRDLRPFFMRN